MSDGRLSPYRVTSNTMRIEMQRIPGNHGSCVRFVLYLNEGLQ
jgi:hypothetical protein